MFVLILIGCATKDINVTLIPVDTSKNLAVKFNRAYYAPTQSGEDQIIVVDDPINDHLNASAGQPLPPMKGPPIWHALVIDLHWRTAPGGNPDSPIADNASLHWYVLGKPTDITPGALEYSGPGAVWISTTPTGADIRVRSEELELLDRHGPLRDPFHGFRITTSFEAVNDAARMKATMDQVNKAIQDASQPEPITSTTKPIAP